VNAGLTHPTTGAALFTHRELACRSTGVVTLHPGFAEELVRLRVAWDRPMAVTSCCRSAAHNRTVGGHPRSLHVYDKPAHGLLGTAAIDIAMTDGARAWELARLAMTLGWSVGVPKSGFLHLDRRDFAGLPRGLFGY
jgi:uncharacterized protein YcbK (DUF882 family)